MSKHPLTTWREANGVSQKDFAERLGVTRWSIVAIETGRRNPSSALVPRIEGLTGISAATLRPDLASVFAAPSKEVRVA